MKVRHKQHPDIVFEVMTDLEPLPGFYRCRYPSLPGRFHARIEVSTLDFEPIHDERWEDVTSDCTFSCGTPGYGSEQPRVAHNGFQISYFPSNYRLRKVKVYITDNEKLEHGQGDAFIVERRVTP